MSYAPNLLLTHRKCESHADSRHERFTVVPPISEDSDVPVGLLAGLSPPPN